MQEYRFRLLLGLASLLESLGIRQRPWQPAWARAGNGDGRGPIRPPARMASLAGLAPVTTGRLPTDQGTKADSRPFHLPPRIVRHRVLVPVNGVHQGTLTALRYAHSISQDVTAVHVSLDAEETEELQRGWATWGEGVRLVVLPSPHQLVLEPLLQYIGGLMARRQDNEILTVVVPQSVRPQWWSNLLRTQMAVLLRLSLPFETGIVITDVPYDVETPLLPVGGAGANRRQE